MNQRKLRRLFPDMAPMPTEEEWTRIIEEHHKSDEYHRAMERAAERLENVPPRKLTIAEALEWARIIGGEAMCEQDDASQ
jgi:hypothetical protein